MKNWIKTMLAVLVLCLSACADDPDVAPLKRDTDAVEVAYNTNATTQVSVRYNGPWSARIACVDDAGVTVDNWFAITPENGVGNGIDYQWVTITAQRNPGVKRSGLLYLQPANGEELVVAIAQADGVFKVEKPEVKGVLKSGTASAATLDIKYDKAFGGEEVKITTTLSGSDEGLAIRELFETTIENEGSGTISVPITGTPMEIGALGLAVDFKLDGETVFQGEVEASVTSPNEVFNMGFEMFLWGGDYPNNAKGPGIDSSNGSAGKDNTGLETSIPDKITAGSDGSSDVFNTMSEAYRGNRGIVGWSGLRVYEHPGYLKLGTTDRSGWIMTPPVAGLTSTPETVVVSIDMMRFDAGADKAVATYMVTAEGAGVVTNGEINAANLPPAANAAGRKWKTMTFTVVGATNQTKIKLSGMNLDAGAGSRLNIDNFKVMGTYKPDLKEPLPAPAKEDIVYIPGDNSIAFSWPEVKYANGYELTIAEQARPDFCKTVEVTSDVTKYTFDDLTPGFHIFTIKALYTANPEFDSEKTELLSGTKGFVTVKLATPKNLKHTALLPNSMTVAWDMVNGASGYNVAVSESGVVVEAKDVTTTSCVFSKNIIGGVEYVVSVKATSGVPEFDSDAVLLTLTTPAPVPLTAPTLSIFVKSNGFAVIEWALSAKALAEQAISSVDYYDFRVKNAAGNVVRSISNFSKFNFAKYKSFRLVWGGLTPGAKYTMEMRRLSKANIAFYLDSEWASVDVTMDAAPNTTGYLLYKDFENYPGGAQPMYGAYGFSVGSTSDFSDPDAILITSGDANSVYTQGVKTTDSYFAAYLPEWTLSEWTNVSSNMGIGAGYMKFGGGTNPAWVTLPKLATLTGATDIIVDIDTCPYLEPSTTGDMMAPSNTDLIEYFYVSVTGGGVITEVMGETSASAAIEDAGAKVKLRNVMVDKMKEEGLVNTYRTTNNKIKISGATADSRIKIYTALEVESPKVNSRMWLDNLKVSKAN